MCPASKEQPLDLRKRRRFSEDIIQAFLFFSGAVSILTTIGIVIVLSRESLAFFTTQLWEDTNKPLAVSIDADITIFNVATSGTPLEVGDIIRINDEVMEVTVIGLDFISVNRGLQGHSPGFPQCRGQYYNVPTGDPH